MIKPSWISFGGTAGIVTSMALIAGLDAARAGRTSMVSALLIAAVADNITDSLSVHMYQESERLEQKEAFIGTLSNFVTRLLLCLSFVLIVVLLPEHITAIWGLVWGTSLLVALTCMLARYRGVSAMSEVGKHLAVALAIILVSQRIGHWIAVHVI
jgi:VIT1/CCC1 family predicted Fe2+/Mn2+ transporter